MIPLLLISGARPHVLQAGSTAVRSIASVGQLLGAPLEQLSIPPAAPVAPPPPAGAEQPGCDLPAICGVPKNRHTTARRRNQRSPYYTRRKELFAQCSYCGQTGMPHQLLVNQPRCTGQCVQAPSKQYPAEYKPPL